MQKVSTIANAAAVEDFTKASAISRLRLDKRSSGFAATALRPKSAGGGNNQQQVVLRRSDKSEKDPGPDADVAFAGLDNLHGPQLVGPAAKKARTETVLTQDPRSLKRIRPRPTPPPSD